MDRPFVQTAPNSPEAMEVDVDIPEVSRIPSAEDRFEAHSQASPSPRSAPLAQRIKASPHLPTPQSPSNLGVYASSLTYADSPIRAGNKASRLTVTETETNVAERNTQRLERFSSSGSLITPEASPLQPWRKKSTLVALPSGPSTPRRGGSVDRSLDDHPAQTTRTSGLLFHPEQGSSRSHLLPAFVESPGPQNLNPFHTPTRTPLSLSRSRPASPSLSPTVSPPAPPPQPLPAPIPQRPAGGEIHRIRMQMAADQAAQMQEMEARRPEYLRRLKRRLSDSDSRPRPPRHEEDPTPGLGVVDSPHKGRRLMFFQETSEESFEQSLLAGGYPSYGVTPAYGEPSTPKSGQFKRTMEIIQQSTPGYRPPSPPKDNLVELSINLEDARKRRRIEAFREHEPLESSTRLFAGEVEGMGRVLVNPDTVHFSKVQPAPPPPETPPRQPETPTKKRNSRRKRGGVTDSPSRKKANVADVAAEPQEPPRPDWPDNAFPWALRIQEREAEMKRQEDERLECIARYLERESDEDDQDDQSLHLPPEPAEESPPLPPRKRGRGKAPAAVVKREPDPPPILRDNMADAVAALRLSLRCRPAVTAAPRNRAAVLVVPKLVPSKLRRSSKMGRVQVDTPVLFKAVSTS